jgi:predicted Ser/Thr protein kinase
MKNQICAVSYVPKLSRPRHSLASAALPGIIIFAGGSTTPSSSDAVDTVDIYDTVSGRNFTSNLSSPRRQLAGAAYGNKLYFAGGISDSGLSNVVDIFDVTTRNWTVAYLSQARYLLQAAVVANKIIFVGGRNSSTTFSDVVDIYDPINDIWSTTYLYYPRLSFGLAGSSTHGLIVGGYVQVGATPNLSSNIERFDPATNLMTLINLEYPTGLVAIGAAQTNSPQELMLFAGGYDSFTDSASTLFELYYPNGTWAGNASMASARIVATPVCFPSLCYISGGSSDLFADKLNLTTENSPILSRASVLYIRNFGTASFDGDDTIAVGGGYNSGGLIDQIEVARTQRIPYKPYNVIIQKLSPLVPFIYWDANIVFTTNFTLERWSTDDPQWRPQYESMSSEYYFTYDAGLNYNTTYRYRIIATSDTGISVTSDEYAELITPAISIPPTPTAIQTIVSSDNTVVISWALGAVNKEESNSTYIVVERTMDLAENFTEIGSILAPNSAFTDTVGLEFNVTYYYRAYTSATFRSEYSEVVSAILLPPPEIPPAQDGSIIAPQPDVAQIVPGVIIPIVIVAVAFIVLLVLLRRGKLRKVSFFAKMEYLLFSSKTLSLNIDLANTAIAERLRIPHSELTIIKQIGMGSYGEVYLGVWKQSHVAIKFCKRSLDIDEFLREAEVMLAIRPHPNIVQVLGVSTDGPQIALVLEFCQGGSLDTLLFDKEDDISAAQKIKLAAGIAAGIYHLHQSNIVHRDLAARNVLLTGDNQPKIADFGMSRLLQTDKDAGATKSDSGPIRWMAPESLRDKSYSTKSDVWSFGIVLFELILRTEPHINEDPLQVGAKIRDQGFTPTIPVDCPHVLKDTMESCWRFEPADRPDFVDICNKLNAAAATL